MGSAAPDSPVEGTTPSVRLCRLPSSFLHNQKLRWLSAMDDEGTPENKHGTKRPRRDTSASDGSRLEPAPMTSEQIESPAIDAGEDTPQPRDEQTPPKSHGGGRAGGRKRDGRVFAADVRAYRRAHKRNNRARSILECTAKSPETRSVAQTAHVLGRHLQLLVHPLLFLLCGPSLI